jgi:hypothetical protein
VPAAWHRTFDDGQFLDQPPVDDLVDPRDASLSVVERVVRFFSYFTVQSNLLVLAAVPAARPGPRP